MTPKETALNLVDKFMNIKQTKISDYSKIYYPTAKECALIVVDAIIDSNPTSPLKSSYILLYSEMVDESIEFWQQVKEEINKL